MALGYLAKTSGTVSVSAASGVIVAANISRRELTIVNDHATQIVYLALNTLDGLALVELKFAPDPTAMPVAASTPTNPIMTFRGEAFHRAENRDMPM